MTKRRPKLTYEEIGKVFVKLRQKISSEMLLALQESAKLHGVSIDVEVASRIWLTFAEPEALGLDSTIIHVLKQGFSYPQAVLECKRKREAWAYLFEIDKLKRFLKMRHKLPRNFKEKFTFINVKEESKRILAEWAARDAKID